MLKRSMLVGVLALAMLGSVSAAAGAATARDSVVGSLVDNFFCPPGPFPCLTQSGVSFEVSSGPGGVNPAGTVEEFGTVRTFTGDIESRVRGSVTCVRVNGNLATVGVHFTQQTSGPPGAPVPFSTVYFLDDGGATTPDRYASQSVRTGPSTCPASPPSGVTYGPRSYFPGVTITKVGAGSRMVGKGAVATASYAYILGCDPTANANAPFELRYGSQRFRLTSTTSVVCWNDPDVPGPATGFDTMSGRGTGTLTPGPPATVTVEWTFVDGGAGGAKDSAQITLRNQFGDAVFFGALKPPGPFPGSGQATGNNTAQST
jgi:hypothetical protein